LQGAMQCLPFASMGAAVVFMIAARRSIAELGAAEPA